MFFLVALLPLLALVSASHNPPHLRHRRLAHAIQQRDGTPGAQIARDDAGHADAYRLIKRAVVKKAQTCRPKKKVEAAVASSSTTSSSATTSSTSAAASASTIDNQNAWAKLSPSSAAAPAPSLPPPAAPSPSPAPPPPPPPAQNNNQGGWSHTSGTLQVNDGRCGWCNSNGDQPNGSQDWLNCGINNGGWSPPHVTIDQLIAKDLNEHGVFAPCSQFFDKFRQYGGEFGVPPIMLASFAMQESTCQPWVTGGGGEAGLMQIAPPNCEHGRNCWDVDYNIRRGAELFRNMLNANGGNVIAALGAYNGWRVGMTYDDATRAKSQGNCSWQNNLDYLTQWLNGWIQDKNGYQIGTYFNLRGC